MRRRGHPSHRADPERDALCKSVTTLRRATLRHTFEPATDLLPTLKGRGMVQERVSRAIAVFPDQNDKRSPYCRLMSRIPTTFCYARCGRRSKRASTGMAARKSETYSTDSRKCARPELATTWIRRASCRLFGSGPCRLGAPVAVAPHAGHTIQASYTGQRADHVVYPCLDMDAIADEADRLRVGYERAAADWISDEFRISSVGLIQPYSMTTQADSSIGGRQGPARHRPGDHRCQSVPAVVERHDVDDGGRWAVDDGGRPAVRHSRRHDRQGWRLRELRAIAWRSHAVGRWRAARLGAHHGRSDEGQD